MIMPTNIVCRKLQTMTCLQEKAPSQRLMQVSAGLVCHILCAYSQPSPGHCIHDVFLFEVPGQLVGDVNRCHVCILAGKVNACCTCDYMFLHRLCKIGPAEWDMHTMLTLVLL